MKSFSEFRAEQETNPIQQLDEQLWAKWKSLSNLSEEDYKAFMETDQGKEAAKLLNIDSSIILQMIGTGKTFEDAEASWNDEMWLTCKKQVNAISRRKNMRPRMKGNPFERDGKKTKWYVTQLIWGHDPKKRS